MVEEVVTQSPAVSVVSIAKFNNLITESLTLGPKKVKEIYRIVLERQPQDCPNVLCTHRKKASKSLEWQHEIQRQLQRLAHNSEGLWHLKSATASTAVESAPEETRSEVEATVIEEEIPAAVVPDAPYTGDPFIITEDGHFMDCEELKKPEKNRFVVPKNFDEFYAWKPEYVLNWVKKRLNRFFVDDEVEDWTQDLIIHLKYLPPLSKYRQPGVNNKPTGCEDVIETFNPIQQYGASERRFRNYINWCLANKFNTLQSKRQKNPICRPGNIPFGASPDEYETEHASGDEFIHANSEFLASNTLRVAKQHEDRLYTNQFKRFVAETDLSVYPAIEALEATGTIGEAAKFMRVSDSEFTRYRNRLKQLAECFEKSTPVPRQRRPYKKRVKEEVTPTTTASAEATSA